MSGTIRTMPGEQRLNLAPVDCFVGPFKNQQPWGTGKIFAVPKVVAAGGQFTVAHGLNRVPVYVRMMSNGTPGYPGQAYIVTATSTSATIQVDTAQTTTSFFGMT